MNNSKTFLERLFQCSDLLLLMCPALVERMDKLAMWGTLRQSGSRVWTLVVGWDMWGESGTPAVARSVGTRDALANSG
jgi:hypothetical protein